MTRKTIFTYLRLIMDTKKKNETLKKNFLVLSEILLGSSLIIVFSTLSFVKHSNVVSIAITSAMITSIAILVTNYYVPKLKLRYTKMKDWVNVISLLYEKV